MATSPRLRSITTLTWSWNTSTPPTRCPSTTTIAPRPTSSTRVTTAVESAAAESPYRDACAARWARAAASGVRLVEASGALPAALRAAQRKVGTPRRASVAETKASGRPGEDAAAETTPLATGAAR